MAGATHVSRALYPVLGAGWGVVMDTVLVEGGSYVGTYDSAMETLNDVGMGMEQRTKEGGRWYGGNIWCCMVHLGLFFYCIVSNAIMSYHVT